MIGVVRGPPALRVRAPVVIQAPLSSAPTITSGTSSTERAAERSENAIVPIATGPVPGRTSGSRHQEA